MLYRVPPRLLDDYYWMIASVSDQIASRNGANIDVSPQNEDRRWPGTRPMLVSNDQMRDHKLEMLEPLQIKHWLRFRNLVTALISKPSQLALKTLRH